MQKLFSLLLVAALLSLATAAMLAPPANNALALRGGWGKAEEPKKKDIIQSTVDVKPHAPCSAPPRLDRNLHSQRAPAQMIIELPVLVKLGVAWYLVNNRD
jgi:hypothetical protein